MVARGVVWQRHNNPESLIGCLSKISPPPCLYDIVMQSYVQWKIPMYFTIVGKNALFHGPSLTIVCQWGNFGALLPPRGYNLYPTAGYVLAQLDNLFICGDLHVSTKFSLGATTRQSWPQCVVYAIFRLFLSPAVRSSYARSLIKVIAHHSSIGRTIWRLFHGSVTNGAGGVARQTLYGRSKNNNKHAA